MTLTLIYLRWYDIASRTPWMSREHVMDPEAECETIGFVVGENDDWIAVAHTVVHGDSDIAGMIKIPKCNITRACRLEAEVPDQPEEDEDQCE